MKNGTQIHKLAGYVLSVGRKSFIAILDIEERWEVELNTDDVSNQDRPLLKPGAFIYWIMTYRKLFRGARYVESKVVIRQIPAWKESQIRKALSRADRVLSKVKMP